MPLLFRQRLQLVAHLSSSQKRLALPRLPTEHALGGLVLFIKSTRQEEPCVQNDSTAAASSSKTSNRMRTPAKRSIGTSASSTSRDPFTRLHAASRCPAIRDRVPGCATLRSFPCRSCTHLLFRHHFLIPENSAISCARLGDANVRLIYPVSKPLVSRP